ncbi:hypothetical protein BDV59DRAFT_67037 [Aspergillus ambiguus]|uniref:uncharacterized protein n=1 Tax=Aspergillus ambiguus TaxID=176160 RepID=UPI003CCD3390
MDDAKNATGRSLDSQNATFGDQPSARPLFDPTGALSWTREGPQYRGALKGQDLSGKRSGKIVQSRPKSLGLLQVLESRGSASTSVIVRENESPWDTFEPIFRCRLAGSVIICVQRTHPFRTAAMREYPMEDGSRILGLYRLLQHENILSARECYMDESRFYIRVDDLPVSLEHLANLKISAHQLSSVVSQILNGLSHLIASGFEHTALTCSNILLGSDGTVKIGALECCEERPPSRSDSPCIKSLANIMMRLMQEYEKDDGLMEVDDLARWPLDSSAVDFLRVTSSARSLEPLKQHPFVIGKDHVRGGLVGLARLAPIATKTFYSITV